MFVANTRDYEYAICGEKKAAMWLEEEGKRKSIRRENEE